MQSEEIISEVEDLKLTAENKYLSRIGKWEYDVVNDLYTWSNAIFDVLELPYHVKPDNALALTFYREPYRGMLKKSDCKSLSIWNIMGSRIGTGDSQKQYYLGTVSRKCNCRK